MGINLKNKFVDEFDFFEKTNWKYKKFKLIENGVFVEQDKYFNYGIEDKNGFRGISDKTGNILIQVEYEVVNLLYNGNYRVRDKNDLYGVIDKDGNIIISYIYLNIQHINNGNYLVKDDNNLLGIIDREGNEIIPCEYDKIQMDLYSNEEIYIVSKNNLWGSIDKEGNKIIPIKYKNLYQLHNGKFEALDEEGNEFIFDMEGNEVGK